MHLKLKYYELLTISEVRSEVYILKAMSLSKIMKKRDLIRQKKKSIVLNCWPCLYCFISMTLSSYYFFISNWRQTYYFSNHVCCINNWTTYDKTEYPSIVGIDKRPTAFKNKTLDYTTPNMNNVSTLWESDFFLVKFQVHQLE